MLAPTDEEKLGTLAINFPSSIPAYGSRGWW